jgi:tetratricopeptide (TPR) repeat protein
VSQKAKTTTLALLLLALLAVYVTAATRLFRAHLAVTSNTLEGLEAGVRMAPGNADYALLLARSRTLGQLDFPRGIAEYQRALTLNPYSSRGWLDLAAAYQFAGDSSHQSQAMQRAVQVDPNTPSVAWEVATFYIVQGEVQKAAPHYRTVLSSQGGETHAVLEILWPASDRNAELILAQVLPPTSKSHVDFLRFAAEQKDVAAANKIWDRLMALPGPFAVSETLPYFQLLLDAHEENRALEAWKQMAKASTQPAMAAYQPQADNLMINGDFEDPLLGGGLEWSFLRHYSVELKVDSLEFHSGNQSLSAIFDQGYSPSLGLTQLVPVAGGNEYRFSVFVKADGLTTASGPRLSVSDAYTGQRFFLSEDQRGTTGWKEIQSDFRVGPETRLLKIEVVREPFQSLIRGKLFLDDFSLRLKR